MLSNVLTDTCLGSLKLWLFWRRANEHHEKAAVGCTVLASGVLSLAPGFATALVCQGDIPTAFLQHLDVLQCLLMSIHPACPYFSCKGLESAFFFSLPFFLFTKLLLFCSLCALEESTNETRGPKAFIDQVLLGFLSDGWPRLLEVQL